MIVSATYRYRKKYVTTLLYKPCWRPWCSDSCSISLGCTYFALCNWFVYQFCMYILICFCLRHVLGIVRLLSVLRGGCWLLIIVHSC